jgi:hypothetical protein
MANELPEFLQNDPEGLHYRNGLIRADLDTGFAVSGRAIVRAPDPDKEPLQHEGAVRLFRAGVITEANRAEYDEQQEANSKLDLGDGNTLDLAEVGKEVLLKAISEGRFVLGATSVNPPVEDRDQKSPGQLQPGEGVGEDEEFDESDRVADDEEADERGKDEEGEPLVYPPRTSSFSIPGYSEPGPKTRKKRAAARGEDPDRPRKKKKAGATKDEGASAPVSTKTGESDKSSGAKVT